MRSRQGEETISSASAARLSPTAASSAARVRTTAGSDRFASVRRCFDCPICGHGRCAAAGSDSDTRQQRSDIVLRICFICRFLSPAAGVQAGGRRYEDTYKYANNTGRKRFIAILSVRGGEKFPRGAEILENFISLC